MITLKVIILALIHISLLLVMGSALVGIMNSDVEFTDGELNWSPTAVKRAMVKGLVFLVAFAAYLYMITQYKFIG